MQSVRPFAILVSQNRTDPTRFPGGASLEGELSDRKPYVLTPLDVRRISKHRANCEACGGDASVCVAGDRQQNRLQGCAAFTDDGMVAPLGRPARQPWEIEEAA